jgi:hypothetical protein
MQLIIFQIFIDIVFNRNDANEVETGVQLAWTAGSNQTRFALASKYQLDPQTVVAAKVNNICQVGLSFQQVLRPGIELHLLCFIFTYNLID